MNSPCQLKPCEARLRDEFAMAALQGLFANPGTNLQPKLYHIAAQWAYDMAGAMMTERAKRAERDAA